MNEPTIVVSCYNRVFSLKRLLRSLSTANYAGYKNVNLIISLDGGGENNSKLRKIVQEFIWKYGNKRIIIHKVNLGLRNHILFCGDLTRQYGPIIILEDDIYVSKNFYRYAVMASDFYFDSEKICGISLYTYTYDELSNSIFTPLNDGSDSFFAQVPSSWGQVWNAKQWNLFRVYYERYEKENSFQLLPPVVNSWDNQSWKKIFFRYMVDQDLYFVYPYVGFSTNFADSGVHIGYEHNLYQIPLENFTTTTFTFNKFKNSCVVYDSFLELKVSCFIKLGANIEKDTLIDLKGCKDLTLSKNRYILSPIKSTMPITVYSTQLLPIENDVLYDMFSTKESSIYYGLRQSFIHTVKVYFLINPAYNLG